MKKITLIWGLTFSLFVGLSFSSCSDDDKDFPVLTPAASTTTACNGGDGFCMNYGGIEKSGSAVLTVKSASNKVRVFWEQGSGTSHEQVELDIYSLSAGTFTVSDLATPNSAFVQYFSTANGVNNVAYGTVTVSILDTISGVTGTFDVTMKDSTKITGGIFRNVVK
ncbi:MAG: hypothetical protein JKY48_06415 [Flavobacteriales bacterium]|nr:hypothetical protein [Flavobacteriales bacterium]